MKSALYSHTLFFRLVPFSGPCSKVPPAFTAYTKSAPYANASQSRIGDLEINRRNNINIVASLDGVGGNCRKQSKNRSTHRVKIDRDVFPSSSSATSVSASSFFDAATSSDSALQTSLSNAAQHIFMTAPSTSHPHYSICTTTSKAAVATAATITHAAANRNRYGRPMPRRVSRVHCQIWYFLKDGMFDDLSTIEQRHS